MKLKALVTKYAGARLVIKGGHVYEGRPVIAGPRAHERDTFFFYSERHKWESLRLEFFTPLEMPTGTNPVREQARGPTTTNGPVQCPTCARGDLFECESDGEVKCDSCGALY